MEERDKVKSKIRRTITILSPGYVVLDMLDPNNLVWTANTEEEIQELYKAAKRMEPDEIIVKVRLDELK